jgi:hypothetical protein
MIRDFAREHGMAFVDLLPEFKNPPAEQKFFRIYGASVDWNHPNPLGHKIIALEVKNAVNNLTSIEKANGKARAARLQR